MLEARTNTSGSERSEIEFRIVSAPVDRLHNQHPDASGSQDTAQHPWLVIHRHHGKVIELVTIRGGFFFHTSIERLWGVTAPRPTVAIVPSPLRRR